MRDLKENERLYAVYENFIVVEVICPHNKSYKTTIPKWKQRDFTTDIKQTEEDRLDKYGYKIKYRR